MSSWVNRRDTPATKNVKAALLKRQYKTALDEAAKLADAQKAGTTKTVAELTQEANNRAGRLVNRTNESFA